MTSYHDSNREEKQAARQIVKIVKPIADICLYGNRNTGAGYLGCCWPHGQSFGTGDPVANRTFTEAVWLGLDDVKRLTSATRGTVRVFDAGGDRMAVMDINRPTTYGFLNWQAAPVWHISADALIAAADKSTK